MKRCRLKTAGATTPGDKAARPRRTVACSATIRGHRLGSSLLLVALLPIIATCPAIDRSPPNVPNEPPSMSGTTDVIRQGGAELSLVASDGAFDLSREELAAWVDRAARSIVAYYGRFPVPRATIEVLPAPGRRVSGGQTLARVHLPRIQVTLGKQADTRALDEDWVLVHEMVHLATPSLPSDQIWFEEGVASYVESIARAKSGWLRTEDVFREWIRGMPQGEPATGDRGLDRTHTWGRTYWGGALFCLQADVTIRERTGNRLGLQDALRAVMENGGVLAIERPIEEVIAIGDSAVGVPVFRELYEQHAKRAARVDLPELWKALGLRSVGREIELDDGARLAGARKAIFELRDAR